MSAVIIPSGPQGAEVENASSLPVSAALITSAHRIQSDLEAIKTAHILALDFKREAAVRDRERRLPHAEIARFSESGLWAITVPKSYGGAGVSWATVAEVIRIISSADPALGQIPQNHFGILNILSQSGSDSQKKFFYGQVLKGARLGNAGPERTSKNVLDVRTRVTIDGGQFRLNGTRFYSTGALFSHWIPTKAVDEQGLSALVFVDRNTAGVSVVDDWSGFGQRTTASGTVIFDNVQISSEQIISMDKIIHQASNTGPVSQLIQAAIDAGIARAALDDTVEFVKTRSRPWVDSGVERAAEDPLVLREIGALFIRLHAAEALLERAANTIDKIALPIDFSQMAQASINVAEAKVLTTEIALKASEKLFELAGSQATLAQHNLDRHWRNARVHTLHDPVRWKYFAIGNYYLNDVAPPHHAWS
ncbi:SfnB family sulfur acquisition oxidoreductase [Glaciimonas sp. PCH181]|uniref:SfnB family sulfur acquisition oxidoreductase n=1 Tax=Glaciimonas sp. PCH181 TaxID=2133943 RepID=UPI000D367DD5|nr:SfnB family sulfur acquisition oxidoreductase [Glaciimonas sp. PCH181]PUA20498.1 SfnB family sulfur acquisition oxidoreductase [Glaciimonas sp. PCH181]